MFLTKKSFGKILIIEICYFVLASICVILAMLCKSMGVEEKWLWILGVFLYLFCILKVCLKCFTGKKGKCQTATDLSICGINCSVCNFFIENKCKGCRVVAPEGKCLWNGRCDLFDCSAKQNLPHCGKCNNFPCEMLKEWASTENTDRIQNLIDLNNIDNN